MHRSLCWSIVALALSASATCLKAADVAWHSDVDLAWQESVRENRPLLVLLTSSGCRHCSQMKAETFQDRAVTSYLDQSFVSVVVDAKKVHWLVKQLRISAYPTTLIISPEAEVLVQLKGFVPPEKLMPQLQQAAPPGRIASRPIKKTS